MHLIQPRHLPVVTRLCARHRGCGWSSTMAPSLPLRAGGWQPWADDISRVARETSALCKLSGLVTEAAAEWRSDDLRRYVDHLLLCFGPGRLMWGSDWPVVNLAGGYTRWREASLELLAGLPATELEAILGRHCPEIL